MQPSFADDKNKLNNLQVEFLKSLKYMASEKQIAEVKSLLRYYFAKQLDMAIEKRENEMKFTAGIYEEWLKNSPESF